MSQSHHSLLLTVARYLASDLSRKAGLILSANVGLWPCPSLHAGLHREAPLSEVHHLQVHSQPQTAENSEPGFREFCLELHIFLSLTARKPHMPIGDWVWQLEARLAPCILPVSFPTTETVRAEPVPA